jgi:hypothetical protein
MRASVAVGVALVIAGGCRGPHVRHAKPQPDPIGNLERRCEHGKLDDCVALAYRYEVGWQFDPDSYDEEEEQWDDEHLRDRDVEYETSSPRAADVLIAPYSGPPRRALAVDYARARTLYAHACTGNEPDACYALGRMRRDGLGGAADLAAADADFVHACNLRELRGCTAHAIALEQGLGIPADPDAGHALMRQLCDEDDHPRACANVGVYLLNDGAPYNDRQAEDYLRRACDSNGDPLGCHFMAMHELRDLRQRRLSP